MSSCMWTHACMFILAWMSLSIIYAYTHRCMYFHVCLYICIYMCIICNYGCPQVCMYICDCVWCGIVYVYAMCVCVYMHIYTCCWNVCWHSFSPSLFFLLANQSPQIRPLRVRQELREQNLLGRVRNHLSFLRAQGYSQKLVCPEPRERGREWVKENEVDNLLSGMAVLARN